jgi:hypothetical protein
MTEEKICPFMSRPFDPVTRQVFMMLHSNGALDKISETDMFQESFVPCQKEKCMAWIPDCTQYIGCPLGYHAPYPCKEKCRCYNGWCRLIEFGGREI